MPVVNSPTAAPVTPNLSAVLAKGNLAGTSVIVDGDDSDYVRGVGSAAGEDDGAAGSLKLGSQSGNNGGVVSLAAGAALVSGATGGNASLTGGTGWGADGARFLAGPGGDTDPGTASIRTGGSFGTAGTALVSNGGNRLVHGGVRVAAGVPVTAPASNLPFAYDTTAVTGGFYFWNSAAWVKVATIL